jgi:hypothetical protein
MDEKDVRNAQSLEKPEDTTQYGPWLRASSPTRRPEKTQKRSSHRSENLKSHRNDERNRKEWKRPENAGGREGSPMILSGDGARPEPRKAMTNPTASITDGIQESFHSGGSKQGKKKVTQRKGQDSGNKKGTNQSENLGKQRYVQVPHNEEPPDSKSFEQRDLERNFSKNTIYEGDPLGQNRLNGGQFSSPGGSLYTGPSISEIAKRMEKAQEAIAGDNLRVEGTSRKAVVSWKRKQREDQGINQENLETNEGIRKKRSVCDANKTGETTPDGGQDLQQEIIKNGSGLAEAVEQPRRPQ